MSYIVHITKTGIVVFDGAGVVNGNNANAVFQATKNSANDTVPIIGLSRIMTLDKPQDSEEYEFS